MSIRAAIANRRGRRAILGGCWVLASLLSLSTVAETPGPASSDAHSLAEEVAGTPRVNAVWFERKLRFFYFPRTVYYSCDALQSKIAYLLQRIGARADAKVSMNCFDRGGPQRMPSVAIKAVMPTEATDEILAQLADNAGELELIALVQGRRGYAEDPMAQFPATWHTVTINGRRDRYLENKDCELVEQLARHVLPILGVQVSRDSVFRCQPRIGSMQVTLQVLQPYVAEPLQMSTQMQAQ